jgi:tRNA nucleotidyltransferase (CCA-adding enzyme)
MGPGHRGFQVELDPNLPFEEASRRRDLTINSMGWDPLTNEIFDPHGGREDIRQKILRATDRATFSEDPLRGLRVAQFAARFHMDPEPLLLELCRSLDLSELPGERLLEEFRKMLLKSPSPSRGLEILRQSELLRFFPELQAMVGVPQDPEWHPEGTVWEHTLMVLDEAAKAKTGDDAQDLIVLFAALSHDLGKPETTFEENGRIRSPQHSEKGEGPTESFLRRLQASPEFINQVKALVRFHLAPTLMVVEGATGKGFRRLARNLEEAGTNSQQLFLVGRADHFGRTTAEALARYYPYGEIFLKTVSDLGVDRAAEKDVVLGRHLIARGLSPSPQFTPILEKCREIQYETGRDDPLPIIDAVLPAHLAFSLPDTRRRVIKSNMVNLPAQPTENDINAVGLMLPAGFKLAESRQGRHDRPRWRRFQHPPLYL